MEWRYEWCYGDRPEEAVEGDIISSVEYDPTGNLLAVGDRGGRVTILERRRQRENGGKKCDGGLEYREYHRFQSHVPEFDYLKSMEIEEKINQIRWLKRQNSSHMVLTTNDKTIKLWKLSPNSSRRPQPAATFPAQVLAVPGTTPPTVTLLQTPLQTASQTLNRPVPTIASPVSQWLRKNYANAHAYHINSISLNSDGETFLSADDLRVNLWHLEQTTALNVVDIKPANMEDLTEVITSASFHPSHCSMFLFSTSKGCMKLCDLRDSALVENFARVFEHEEEGGKTFFSEIISSISDVKFSRCGRYAVSRDYLTLKIWDLNMERRPVKTIHIHEPLRERLCDLYENDCIFDKFECAWSHDGKWVTTGSYKNQFKIFDATVPAAAKGAKPQPAAALPPPVTLEASKQGAKKKKSMINRFGKKKIERETYEKSDFNLKVLHMTTHPTENEVAVAALNHLFMFTAQPT
eukprot:TRINITY_DN12970_c1_g1_i2.p1 TRINITY_DN12970_c1_g1~~TRINITY_DN12970_c1_g1_i2.p1  ORF type:complete len:465 (-),score=96.17 TRINITY_DN12970_c1_g1_i2:1381-2775(-)